MMLEKIKSLFFVCVLLISKLGYADTTLVAVASNFTKPMTEIAAEFEKTTGHSAQLSFGSSGKFVSQIENGAPFEVFLAADDKNALKLQVANLIIAESRSTYALGKLALWSNVENYVDGQGNILETGDFKHLALADAKLAPYGAAAVEVLQNKKVFEKLQSRFVIGENISQTHQFISSGNAELGFVALSQVIENGKILSGSAWIVPQNFYTPIKQDAVLLKIGAENPAALSLLHFLKSASAKEIIQKYGYDLPN
jgi:molybdate transport system substrate-binding protein